MPTIKAVKKGGKLLWNCKVCETILQKMKGLMFRKSATPLLFVFETEATTANSIHSFFCPRFDAVFLSASKEIVDLRQNIAPWNPWIAPKKAAKYLIELPANGAKKVRIGEKLDF